MHIHFASCNNIHDNNFEFERKDGLADFLLVYFKTPSLLNIRDHSYTISKPSIILLSSFTPFKYASVSSGYLDNYLHFVPDDKEEFEAKLLFPMNIPIEVSYDMSISSIWEMICREYQNRSDFSMEIQYHHVMLLMLRIGELWKKQNTNVNNVPYYDNLHNLRTKIKQNPSQTWTVHEMAQIVGLSPAYFQMLYKKAFGITCLADVIQTKLDSAKALLLDTDLQINDIADELGYTSVYHFIRQFKKNTGLTPGVFRKKMR